MRKSKEINKLKDYIAQLKPLRNVAYSLVIEALSDCKVIPFNEENEHDCILLTSLTFVARAVAQYVFTTGIVAGRPNEVGNYIEPIIKHHLKEQGLIAETPLTQKGFRKSTGYPDILFFDKVNRPNYLECKTYNSKNSQ